MTTGSGEITPISTTGIPDGSGVVAGDAQIFCNIDELMADADDNGGDPVVLMKHIRAASQVILQEIGRFIPLTQALRLSGNGRTRLFVPPLLAITSIVNDDDTLVPADYLLLPNGRMWNNGPYTHLDVDPDATNLSSWENEKDSIVITGRWGLYEKYEDTGATVGSAQSAVASTLLVSNGSKLSPGMVALIGSEQELLTGYGAVTSSATTLAEDLDLVEEEITVANGALVYVGEIIRCGFEQMKILDINSNTLYVKRGWNGTKKAIHTTSGAVDVYRTFNVERGANGTTAGIHTLGSLISHYLVPEDVRILCVEIATLMRKKALGGFAGRSGNSELGEVYYHDLFPRFDLDRVRTHYLIPEAA